MTDQQNNLDEEIRQETFRASSGKTVILRSVSPFLIQKANATIPEPKPPTYKFEGLTGEIELAYDEESVQDDETPEEDKIAWQTYLKEKEAAAAKQREKLISILFTRGVVVEVPDDGWEEDQEFLGIKVPENPIERRIHYLETEVFTSPQDLTSVLAKLMQLTSGATDEEMEEVRNSFRGALQRAPVESVAAEEEKPKRRRRSRKSAASAEGVDV